MKTISGKQAVVRLGGVDLVALTPMKLFEGQSIVGRVESVEPAITVSLLRGGSTKEVKTTELMRLLMPSKKPIGDALAKVMESAQKGGLAPRAQQAIESATKTLTSVLSLSPEDISPEKIREAIKNSGLFMEAALKDAATGASSGKEARTALEADIKAVLSKTFSELEKEVARLARDAEAALKAASAKGEKGAETKSAGGEQVMEQLARVRDTVKNVKDAINNIELNQLMNSMVKKEASHAQTAPLLYQIPFMGEGTAQTARIYVKPRDKESESATGRKKKDESRVVFMLDMSRIGPTRIDVSVASGRVSGTIYVMDERVANHARTGIPELAAALKEGGYEAFFDISVAERKFVTEEIENSIPIIVEQGLINVRA